MIALTLPIWAFCTLFLFALVGAFLLGIVIYFIVRHREDDK